MPNWWKYLFFEK